MGKEKSLAEARLDLLEFLTKHPELVAFQNNVDKILENSEDRLETILYLLNESMVELQVETLLLKYKLERLR